MIVDVDRAKRSAGLKRYAVKWRAAAITKLGGKCARCGFADIRALQFDHVNGDGHSTTRVSTKSGIKYRYRANSPTMYKKIAEGTNELSVQLLCANCNWIKRVDQKEDQTTRVYH